MLAVKQCVTKIPLRSISSTASRLNGINLSVDDKTGIATLELNHPPVNTLNTPVLQAISSALTEVGNNKSKGLILTTSSPKVFSAGLDIMAMYKPENPEKFRVFWSTFQEVWLKLYGSAYPTAAAISGAAPAGGCVLALCCEYRAMCPNFTIGLGETRLGIAAPFFIRLLMSNVMTARQAEKALTLGTMFTTDEAAKIGIIDDVASDKADAIKRCTQFILDCGKVSPDARTRTKLALRGKDLAELQNNREAELQEFYTQIISPTVQNAIETYLKALKARKSS